MLRLGVEPESNGPEDGSVDPAREEIDQRENQVSPPANATPQPTETRQSDEVERP